MAFNLNNPVNTLEICTTLKLESNNLDFKVFSVTRLDDRIKGAICFSNDEFLDVYEKDIVIVNRGCVLQEGQSAIFSNNPRLDFMRVLNFLEDKQSFIDPSKCGKIDATAKISDKAYVEEGATIGKNTVVEPGVCIYANAQIGDGCILKANSVIGIDGFGFERGDDDTPIKFTHLGRVIIGNNVEIGASTAVCRGTLSDTVIEDGVKIDNLVHIAHNCHIKKNSYIIACSELSGGVVVGESAWVGPNSSIIQKRHIGDNALVGIGSVVTKDVPENTVFAGNPAKYIRTTVN